MNLILEFWAVYLTIKTKIFQFLSLSHIKLKLFITYYCSLTPFGTRFTIYDAISRYVGTHVSRTYVY